MFDLFKPHDKRIHLASPFVWPFREGSTFVDRYYSILAPVVCTKRYHTFLGNPDETSGICPSCKQRKATHHA